MNTKLLELTPDQEDKILASLKDFRGMGTTMESALGALIVGQHYGWRILKLIHNPSTFRKYEKILGLEFKELCPEITESSSRNVGYVITQKLGSFWDVVMGRKKVNFKGKITDEANAKEIAELEIKKHE